MIRFIALFFGFIGFTPAFAAEPILIPDVTPGGLSEFSMATAIQEALRSEFKDEGYMVLSSQNVRPVVGSQIDGCFEEQTCPYGPLQHLPARLAVVARVLRDVDRVLFQVAVYDGTTIQPVDTHELEIMGSEYQGLVSATVQMVKETEADLEPAPDSLWQEAAELVTKSAMAQKNASTPAPEAPIVKATPDVIVNINQAGPATTVQAGPAPEPKATARPVQADAARPPEKRMTYPPRYFFGAKKDYEKSGLEPRGWMLKRTPHSGRFIVALAGGVGIGDVDRAANVHVRFTDDAVYGWYQEGPSSAARPRGSAYLGYAPTAAFDLGVTIGLQYGYKVLVSGWSDQTSSSSDTSTNWGQDTAQAVQVYIQPRARFYFVWTGPLKPYAYAGVETRVFDALKIADSDMVDYPDPSGGVFYGPTVGGGVMVDPSPTVGLFVEGGYTAHFGIRASFAENDVSIRPDDAAAPTPFKKRTIGIVGGVQFRL